MTSEQRASFIAMTDIAGLQTLGSLAPINVRYWG